MKPLNYNNPMRKSQVKRAGRRVDDSTIGTHVTRGIDYEDREDRGRREARNAQKRTRAMRRGEYGTAEYVTPHTSTRETHGQYQRRLKTKSGGQALKKANSIKRILLIILAVILLGVVGFAATTCAFSYFVSGSMAAADPRVKEMLTTSKDSESYILLAADLDSVDGNTDSVDTMLLARLDSEEKSISLLQIPGNIEVRFTDNQVYLANEACDQGGHAELIYGVGLYLNVDIAHYVHINATGLETLIDKMGGIEVSITHEIDDPAAGSIYIPTGTQTLSGAQALTYLKCQNFSEGLGVRAQNQANFGALMIQKAGKLGETDWNSALDAIAGNTVTDMSVSTMKNLFSTYAGITAAEIMTGYMPGYEVTHNGQTTFIVATSSFAVIWDNFTDGKSPAVPEQERVAVDRSSFTITVRNGSGVDSGASKIAAILTDAGFVVTETGNAEAYVYTETLVIYRDDALASAAKEIVETLGCGRTYQDVGFYVFNTDVLVVLGSDWHPSIF